MSRFTDLSSGATSISSTTLTDVALSGSPAVDTPSGVFSQSSNGVELTITDTGIYVAEFGMRAAWTGGTPSANWTCVARLQVYNGSVWSTYGPQLNARTDSGQQSAMASYAKSWTSGHKIKFTAAISHSNSNHSYDVTAFMNVWKDEDTVSDATYSDDRQGAWHMALGVLIAVKAPARTVAGFSDYAEDTFAESTLTGTAYTDAKLMLEGYRDAEDANAGTRVPKAMTSIRQAIQVLTVYGTEQAVS